MLTAPTTRLLTRAALGAAELLTSPALLRPRTTLGSAELLASAATEILAALLGSPTKLLAGLDTSRVRPLVEALLRRLVAILDALAILRIVLELRPAAALSLLDAL